jgi:predicted outer membrane repeat protein
MLVAAGPAAAASPTACRVKNLDTGITKASLQKAHDAARAGHRLTVRGTCAGITTIRKNLAITGIRTATSGRPILDGKLNGTVVTLRPDVVVTMRGLTIRSGATPDFGGGIVNRGTLVLRDVIVRGNTAGGGAGVFNDDLAILTLNGSSSISGNTTGWAGGGVYNFGVLRLNSRSAIRGNTADWGGGIHNEDPATLTLNGSSSITGNTAYGGGGVFNDGTLKMTDASRISQNTADEHGGGIYVGLGTLEGVRWEEPDTNLNNVRGNTPDDVYFD